MLKLSKETNYLSLIFLAPVLVLVLIVADAVRQAEIADQIQTRLRLMRESGLPTAERETLNVVDRDQTQPNMHRWQRFTEIGLAAYRFASQYPSDVRDIEKLVPPSENWEAEPYARLQNEQDQVLLVPYTRMNEELDQTQYRTLHSQRFNSGWENYRSYHFVEMQTRDFLLAFHAGDLDRAAELITVIRDQGLLRSSLQFDVWNTNQLEQLRRFAAAPLEPAKTWQQNCDDSLVRSVQTLRLAEPWSRDVSNNTDVVELYPLGLAPAHAIRTFEYHDRMAAIKNAGTLVHAITANEVQFEVTEGERIESLSVVAIPWAIAENRIHYSYLANAAEKLTQSVLDQKWTIAAIAIRQFQQQEGRLPTQVEELRKVGLTRADRELGKGIILRLQGTQDGLVLSTLDVSGAMQFLEVNASTLPDGLAWEERIWQKLEMH